LPAVPSCRRQNPEARSQKPEARKSKRDPQATCSEGEGF